MSRFDSMDGSKLGFDKPLDIATAFMYTRFHEEFGYDPERPMHKDFKIYEFWNVDRVRKISEIIHTKSDDKITNYKEDHSIIFYNTGRLILTNLVAGFIGVEVDKYDAVTIGEIKGIMSYLNDIAYSLNAKVSKDFAKDQIDDTVSPVLFVTPYFENDIRSCNHAELFPIMATALYYVMLGFAMNNMEDTAFKEFFEYGEDSSNKDGKKLLSEIEKIIPDANKFSAFGKFADMYYSIISHLEVSIGKTFDNRFHNVFYSIGKAVQDLFNTEYKETPESIYDDIIDEKYDMNSAAMLMVRELHRPASPLYVGDHPYDLRKMYVKFIYGSKPYKSYLNTRLDVSNPEEEINLDWANLKEYRSVVDCHAYERAIKKAILIGRNLKESNSEKFVKDFYMLKYIERLISNAYKFWSNLATPLKIVGVDDLCVEVEISRGTTRKEVRNINSLKWSMAYEKVREILTQFNARYCEAYEFSFVKGEDESLSNFYRKTERLGTDGFHFESIEDAVNAYTVGKLPYLVTIGAIKDREMVMYLENNKTDIDFEKLRKLNLIDGTISDKTEVDPRSIFDVISNKDFSDNVLSGETATKVAAVLKDLTNAELIYIIR